MGNCLGGAVSEDERAAIKQSKLLEAEAKAENAADAEIVKLLLLGAGESGKSTIFKQMRVLYGKGFDDESRKSCNPVICSNLISGARTVLEVTEKMGREISDEKAVASAKLVTDVSDDQTLSPEIAEAIQILWKDEQFQQTYSLRSEYQLFDCFGEFAHKLEEYPEWGGKDWVPSVSDVLKARVRTSGIVEEDYTIDGVRFKMYDVGGQRNERKKWIHCFDNVTAVIFVGAISEYDQVLYEDKSQNRFIEAVDLFDEICNSKWFTDTAMILFLNKRDLFEIKFADRKVPLNVSELPFFEDAPKIDWDKTERGAAISQAHQWFVQRFVEKNKDGKELYYHITCATDTENVKTVFNSCKDIILKSNLRGSGFMD